ncbi:MAG: AAA family ATPase [Janthinobacterium lividum]
MNEQLIVKNFGPIENATVDFKRVTVFIGPTGGGKSTLAKLAAVFRNKDYLFGLQSKARYILFESLLDNFSILRFRNSKSELVWDSLNVLYSVKNKVFKIDISKRNKLSSSLTKHLENFSKYFLDESIVYNPLDRIDLIHEFHESNDFQSNNNSLNFTKVMGKFFTDPIYIPSERVFASSIEGAGFSLRRSKTAIPYSLENFIGLFEVARKNHDNFSMPIFGISYRYYNGQNILDIGKKTRIELNEGASGIQATLPLMLVVEDLSMYIDTHSFIIEEPELNLYPTAQQGLLNWLVEKCTKGENDLTITTHSPYILSSCNLLLEAYKVAQQRPELAEDIAVIVPKECWINPDEFAAYYVADGTVKPITDDRTHLIGANELDAVSGDIADSFRKLLRLQKQKQPSA